MLFNNCRKLVLALIIIQIFSLDLMAEEITIETHNRVSVTGVKAINKKLSDKELTLLGMTLEVSKLKDVKAKFKGNDIYKEGDAAHSLSMLCYIGKDGTIVTFEAGEMGGSENTLGYIGVYGKNDNYRLKDKCAVSDLIDKNVEISDIKLGMDKKAILKSKKEPSKNLPDQLIYYYLGKQKTKMGNMDVSSTIELKFVDGKVSHIGVSKVQSL